MSYRRTFSPTADQRFRRLPLLAKREFSRSLDALAKDPSGARSGLDAHQLPGYRNVGTLRIPSYLGVYVIDGHELVWIVFGPRGSVDARLHALLPPDRPHIARDRAARR
jgi:hypothetical protein